MCRNETRFLRSCRSPQNPTPPPWVGGTGRAGLAPPPRRHRAVLNRGHRPNKGYPKLDNPINETEGAGSEGTWGRAQPCQVCRGGGAGIVPGGLGGVGAAVAANIRRAGGEHSQRQELRPQALGTQRRGADNWLIGLC